MFTDPTEARRYLLAGHAVVTLTSGRTGAWYTYKVSQARDRETGRARDDLHFVGLLTGPDNGGDYTYLGAINGTFKLTAKSKHTPESVPVRAFAYLWRNLEAGRMPPEVEVRHEGRCGCCGRRLTVPESIDSGIGPECRRKMGV